MDCKILIALQSIKKKDSSQFRTLLFTEYRKKYWLSELSYSAYKKEFLRPFIVLLIFIYCFRKILSISLNPKEKSNEIYIYNYANEKKSILQNFPNAQYATELTYINEPTNIIRNLRRLLSYQINYSDILRLIKISLRLSKRNSFLVSARQIEFLLLYSFYKNIFRKSEFKEIYISSESNPEIISAALACPSGRINYTNHGFLNKDLGFFFHDRLILDSSPLKDRIVPFLRNPSARIAIIEKKHGPRINLHFSTNHILILGSLIFDLNCFKKLIEECHSNLRGSKITVRFHPNKTFFDPLIFDYCQNLDLNVSFKQSLKEQLAESSLVIAGETSAHLDALAQGVPVIYYQLDQFPRDHYGFISSHLVPEVKSLIDLKNCVQKFYSEPEWLKVYNDYFGEEK